MIFKFTLLSSILLASAALTVPSRQLQSTSHDRWCPQAKCGVKYYYDFTGYKIEVYSVTQLSSIITVPQVQSGQSGQRSASAFINIGGHNSNNSVKLGFAFGSNDGSAWYNVSVFSNGASTLYPYPIQPGNEIVANITHLSPTSVTLSLYDKMSFTPPFELPVDIGIPFGSMKAGWFLEAKQCYALPGFDQVSFNNITLIPKLDPTQNDNFTFSKIQDDCGNEDVTSFNQTQDDGLTIAWNQNMKH